MFASLLLNVLVITCGISSIIHAARLPLHERRSGHSDRRAPASSSVSVANFENINYHVDINVGGDMYSTLIDTGSGDLWIFANVSNTSPTDLLDEIEYAIGSVEGHIYHAPLSFAGYNIPAQAFGKSSIEVQDISTYGDPRAQGYTALLGLGPGVNGSTIYTTINTFLDDNITGLPVMQNIFGQNMTSENYISFLLPRAFDTESPTSGEMTISELIPGREAIADQKKLPLTYLDTTDPDLHWNTVMDLDGIIGPDGNPIIIETQTTLPSPVTGNGRLVGVFDTGFTFAQVPAALASAIYSGVDGAQLVPITSSSQDLWVIPCDAEVNVTFVIGGQNILIHPLDMVSAAGGGPVNDTSICIGTFQPQGSNTASSVFDMILGTPFFRNAYVLFDYGNLTVGTSTDQRAPFIQLLSTTNAIDAHNDFVRARTDAGVLGS
ncbi:hypothetical protein FRB97_002319 [Tulasnella sp. 331]|nr:hypothetical protein FRB97_002319 [Tulasnella sp. 331]